MKAILSGSLVRRIQWTLLIAAQVLCSMFVAGPALANGSGTIYFTQRFDGAPTIVNRTDWMYDRATPSIQFSNQQVIWSGVGAQVGMGPDPCPESRLAGSDGIFFTPARELVVGNWEPGRCVLPGQIWKFDPDGTDAVLDGPEDAPFAFHLLLHPNEVDFLAAPALGGFACTSGRGPVPRGCFGVHAHTPLVTITRICLAPLDSEDNHAMQPVSFIADGDLNMFALFNEGVDVEFGGAGFASFDIGSTTSASCAGDMAMHELIHVGIEAGHSISWDPFLSDTSGLRGVPHSDFIIFANSRIGQIRVLNPGAPGASASVVATIDMAVEELCDSLLPSPDAEFDQGAVTGDGIAMVGDEHSGYLALVDYSQNTNGLIVDGANTVCLTEFLHDGIDDIAPLTGLGADPLLFDSFFNSSFEAGEGPPQP